MAIDKRTTGKATSVTPTRRDVIADLARRSGGNLTSSERTPGAMCQQREDWSQSNACIPQKFVQLVGHRDATGRASSVLLERSIKVSATAVRKKSVPNDTPIG